MYIWEQKAWPGFTWDAERILPNLSQVRRKQGNLLARLPSLGLSEEGFLLENEIVSSSLIEDEPLDPLSIRSSIARRLGLPTAGLPSPREGDGFVAALLDAMKGFRQPLTSEKLCSWQASLFPTGYSGPYRVTVGRWRGIHEQMQIISGSLKHEVIHYEAPPSERVPEEMERFIRWWNTPDAVPDGIIRAALAHLWFVSIHPFSDGNGRLARLLSDLALAQDEHTGTRGYAMSQSILQQRTEYYAVLESMQQGDLDVTDWIVFFIDMMSSAIDASQKVFLRVEHVAGMYARINSLSLNERQQKVIRKLIDIYPEPYTGGLTNRNFVSITKTSRETAKRDLADLVFKQVLTQSDARGRSVSYQLNLQYLLG